MCWGGGRQRCEATRQKFKENVSVTSVDGWGGVGVGNFENLKAASHSVAKFMNGSSGTADKWLRKTCTGCTREMVLKKWAWHLSIKTNMEF